MPSPTQVLLQIAQGLHYVHTEFLVHRDIKPANILIYEGSGPYCVIKLADFDLSKPTNEEGSHSQSGFKGTKFWIAPEYLQQADTHNPNSSEPRPRGSIKGDIFSSGCTFFYYVMEGQHPFGIIGVGETTMNMMKGNAINLKSIIGKDVM